MFLKRAMSLTAALLCALLLPVGVSAAQVDCDGVYCFREEDFSSEGTLTGVCLTALPDRGTVNLGSRTLRPGDILTAQQAAQMTFSPALTEADEVAQVGYLPIYSDHVGPEAVMTIAVLGKQNQPPVAEDLALETYKNLERAGRLKVSDPEGQAVTYTLVRAPRRGSVNIQADGSFTYTPKKNKVGVDSFTYTATDEGGQTSREATVTITILKPTDAAQYTDTQGRECRFAAEWMKNTGIFLGETVAQAPCFSPDKDVTRGEFVAMLVKALDIPAEEDLDVDYADEIPDWLRPYLAAAVRSGLTAGLPEQDRFSPDSPITGAEAAVMLQNALDLTASRTAADEQDAAPAWARSAVSALAENGIALSADANLTRDQAAQALYQTTRLLANRSR